MSGLLRVGNIRAALFNWLYAWRQGGMLILRLDDTHASLAAVRQSFSRLGKADLGEAFLFAVHGNLAMLDGARLLATVVNGTIQPVVEDADF